jgi:hypothetical protein
VRLLEGVKVGNVFPRKSFRAAQRESERPPLLRTPTSPSGLGEDGKTDAEPCRVNGSAPVGARRRPSGCS